MTLQEFTLSLKAPGEPEELNRLSPLLQALWHDARGNWQMAHGIAQDREGSTEFDRLHAYLHRKEGDDSNAGYWYRRARAKVFQGSLQEEWDALAGEWLANGEVK